MVETAHHLQFPVGTVRHCLRLQNHDMLARDRRPLLREKEIVDTTRGEMIPGIGVDGHHLRRGEMTEIEMSHPIGGGRTRGIEDLIEGGKGTHAGFLLGQFASFLV